MTFVTDKNLSLTISELVNGNQIFIYDDLRSFVLHEKEMRELRKHLTIQIRKIKSTKQSSNKK
jgi:hypothetical protein